MQQAVLFAVGLFPACAITQYQGVSQCDCLVHIQLCAIKDLHGGQVQTEVGLRTDDQTGLIQYKGTTGRQIIGTAVVVLGSPTGTAAFELKGTVTAHVVTNCHQIRVNIATEVSECASGINQHIGAVT